MFNNTFKDFYRVSIYEKIPDLIYGNKSSCIGSPRVEFVRNIIVYKTDDGFKDIFSDKIIEAYSDYRSIEVGTHFININEGIIPFDKFLDYSNADDESKEIWLNWINDFNSRNNYKVRKLGRKRK